MTTNFRNKSKHLPFLLCVVTSLIIALMAICLESPIEAWWYCRALSNCKRPNEAFQTIVKLADGQRGIKRLYYALDRIGSGDQWLDLWLLSGPVDTYEMATDVPADFDDFRTCLDNWDQCLAERLIADKQLRHIWLHWIKYWHQNDDWVMEIQRGMVEYSGLRRVWAATFLLLSGLQQTLGVYSLTDLQANWEYVRRWYIDNLPILQWDDMQGVFVLNQGTSGGANSNYKSMMKLPAVETPLPYWSGDNP